MSLNERQPRYMRTLLSIQNDKRIVGISARDRVLGYRVHGGFLGRGKEANRCALTITVAHYIAGWDCGLWSEREKAMMGTEA